MKKINDNNIDEIMFGLLEGEITGEERRKILEAIYADPAYTKLWETWQNTIITPDTDAIDFDAESLKKRSTPVFKINIRYAVAATIFLALLIGFYRFKFSGNDSIQLSGIHPPKPNKPVIQTPPQPDKITNHPLLNNSDTIITRKETIKHMASSDHHTKNSQTINKDAIANTVTTAKTVIPEIKENKMDSLLPAINPDQNLSAPSIKEENTILVSVEPSTQHSYETTDKKQNLFKRLFGESRIKLVNDSNTLTNKKIVIENKKYQIIAGF